MSSDWIPADAVLPVVHGPWYNGGPTVLATYPFAPHLGPFFVKVEAVRGIGYVA